MVVSLTLSNFTISAWAKENGMSGKVKAGTSLVDAILIHLGIDSKIGVGRK